MQFIGMNPLNLEQGDFFLVWAPLLFPSALTK